MSVLVFKTDIANHYHRYYAGEILQSIPGIVKWSVDMDDIDLVLRVEAMNLQPEQIEEPLLQAGYFCRELED